MQVIERVAVVELVPLVMLELIQEMQVMVEQV